jgi:putative membrane protein
MPHDLSQADRQRVTEAITKAEKSTRGEIVAVAARQSDDYVHVPLHIATALALAVPLIVVVYNHFFVWNAIGVSWIFVLQLLTFIVAALILSLPTIRFYITPRKLMQKYASRNAAQQFLALNTSSTQGRTGVLIFVSILERYVEIIGDTGIASRVDKGTWQEIVNDMLPLLRQHRTSDAMILAVERCGAELAKHFPPGKTNPNELPDRFIVLN